MNIGQTDNFFYIKSFSLGSGHYGTVYQGVHKKNGEPVAIKVLKADLNERQLREFEVMRELSHKNIVKLIAEETELQSRKKVLVLELCNRGSLFSILYDPENRYGLKEEMFLRVLVDISCAMKYLRDKNVVHRDIKPGNIVACELEDKTLIFKLCDFGVARFLNKSGEFETICGTAEYLSPDMYARACGLDTISRTPFKARVDLWSWGVTLYHLATGSLPFQPYNGTDNKITWHHMTTKKESGVISGVQRTKDGPIEWNRELPETCLLSQGLKNLLTVLLAGIMECDEKKMWSFGKFFAYVADIASRKVFNVFYVNEKQEIKLYMEPNNMLEHLKKEIESQTKVPFRNQLLLFDKSLLEFQIDSSLDVSTFPSTSVDQPIFLVHMEATISDFFCQDYFVPTAFHSFPDTNPVDTEADAKLALKNCHAAYAVQRLVVKLSRCQKLLLSIPKILMLSSKENVAKLSLDSTLLIKDIEKLDLAADALEGSYSLAEKLLSRNPSIKELPEVEKKKLRTSLSEIKKEGMQCQASIHQLEKFLKDKWKETLSDSSYISGCSNMADTYVRQMCDSLQVFQRACKRRCFDAVMHKLERLRMEKAIKKLSELKTECLNSATQASRKLAVWYSGELSFMTICSIKDKDLVEVKERLKNYSSDLQKVQSEVFAIGEKCETNVPTETPEFAVKSGASKELSKKKKSHNKEILSECDLLKQGQEDIKQEIEAQGGLLNRIYNLMSWP